MKLFLQATSQSYNYSALSKIQIWSLIAKIPLKVTNIILVYSSLWKIFILQSYKLDLK